MTIQHVNALPIAIFILMPSTFLVTYIISVSLGHVPAEFPYISDTGSFSPESCIFSQLVNVIALLLFVFVWVRFAQVRSIYGAQLEYASVLRINNVSFWFGTVCSIGISIVSNFQAANLIAVHLLGAVLCFLPGMIYISMQTIISYRTTLCSKTVTTVRIILSHLGALTLFVLLTTAPISVALFHGESMAKWKPSDGGFVYHAISTIAEWVLALGFDVFILTYSTEFRDLCIEPPKIYPTSELVNSHISETPQPTDDGYLPEADMYRPVVVQTEPYRELLA